MVRNYSRVLVVSVLAAVLGALGLAPAAVAQEEPTAISVSLTGTATLVAKGAAVDVEVLYRCSSEFPESISVATVNLFNVTQRIGGGRLATGSGSGSDSLECDGAEHLVVARVFASGDLAFKKGDAVARGSATLCDLSCTFLPFSGTIRIR